LEPSDRKALPEQRGLRVLLGQQDHRDLKVILGRPVPKGKLKLARCKDRVHMMISIPSKYAVAQVIGCIKGKCHAQSPELRRETAEFRGATFLGSSSPLVEIC